MTPSPTPLWVVSRRGIDLAIVSAKTQAEAVAAVREALSGVVASVHLRADRIGSARFGAKGIVRVLSSTVNGHDQRDTSRYYSMLAGAALAIGIDPVVASRSRHPRAIAARWAAWYVAAEDMSLAAIGRASRHHHTTIRNAIPLVQSQMSTNPDLAAAVAGARRAGASLQRADMDS